MPFTGSHPAAVLPLMRLGLVPSALVIGSMTPDLPYYLPVGLDSGFTHSAQGVLGLDLALGYLSFTVWQLLVAPLAVAVAPAALRERLAPGLPVTWRHHLRGPRAVVLVVCSLWIGAATHVFWDAFTHNRRWGFRHVGWLASEHGPLPGYRWAQYVSGLVGAVLIVHAAWRWWRATPVADPASQRVPRLTRATATSVWTAIVLAALAGGAAGASAAVIRGEGLAHGLFLIATWGGAAGLFAVLICAVLWSRSLVPSE